MSAIVSSNESIDKQPVRLYLISLISLWERYGYYTMQTIVVLYMVKIFLFSDIKAYSIFAVFSALFYLMPIVGGYIADNFWGAKKSVVIGGLILGLGYALLANPGTEYFYLSLATISVGGGLFIPNIATLVSHLYKTDDQRREGGFSIFYTAINVGSFFPPLISAYLIFRLGWHAAFYMASLSVLISVVITVFCLHESLNETKKEMKSISKVLPYAVIGISVFLLLQLLTHTFHASLVIFSISGLFILLTLFKSLFYERLQRNKLLVCLLLIVLSIIFGVLYQQAAMSLTIYTEYNVQRQLGHWIIPTVIFRSLNPFFIILLGPLLARIWLYLSKRSLNPSVAIKFGMGTFFMGLGFVVLLFAISISAEKGQINLWWIVLSYFLQTVGEMLVSPIGLSMVSELAPAKMLSLMMGTWYFATAVADALAGFVSTWATIPSGSNNPLLTSSAYAHTFGMIGVASLIVGIFIIIASPQLCSLTGKKSFDT